VLPYDIERGRTPSASGEGWRSTPDDPFRLKKVGTWSPEGKEARKEVVAPTMSQAQQSFLRQVASEEYAPIPASAGLPAPAQLDHRDGAAPSRARHRRFLTPGWRAPRG
jgi:hypothetical protein